MFETKYCIVAKHSLGPSYTKHKKGKHLFPFISFCLDTILEEELPDFLVFYNVSTVVTAVDIFCKNQIFGNFDSCFVLMNVWVSLMNRGM